MGFSDMEFSEFGADSFFTHWGLPRFVRRGLMGIKKVILCVGRHFFTLTVSRPGRATVYSMVVNHETTCVIDVKYTCSYDKYINIPN